MGYLMVESGGNDLAETRFRILAGTIQRMRGLLLTGPDACPVVLMRCASVHTVGMGYPLDLAFVDEGGEVLAAHRGVPPGRVVTHAGAFCVFERPEAGDEAWFRAGERVRALSLDPAGEDGGKTDEEEGHEGDGGTRGSCGDEGGWHGGGEALPALWRVALLGHGRLLRMPLRLHEKALPGAGGAAGGDGRG